MISVTSQSHFVLWKKIEGGGGGGGLILGLLFRISEYGPRWNHMDITSLEMDSMTPKTPDNMYHT